MTERDDANAREQEQQEYERLIESFMRRTSPSGSSIRRETRIEVLRDLLTLAENGTEITVEALSKMIEECERAITPLQEME